MSNSLDDVSEDRAAGSGAPEADASPNSRFASAGERTIVAHESNVPRRAPPSNQDSPRFDELPLELSAGFVNVEKQKAEASRADAAALCARVDLNRYLKLQQDSPRAAIQSEIELADARFLAPVGGSVAATYANNFEAVQLRQRALTIGTCDGATIEIGEEAGGKSFFLFGLTADHVEGIRGWYDPRRRYENGPRSDRLTKLSAESTP